MKRCDKALRKAYRKGRKDGFDHGFNVAKMIFSEIEADLIIENNKKVDDLKKEIEALNSELILGEEDTDGEAEDTDHGCD